MMNQLETRVANAIRLVQSGMRWKPGKDIQHLRRRIDLGHLPHGATVDEYQAIIAAVINGPLADVFVYSWDDMLYPTVVAEYGERYWLVMFSLSGVMETAFPPDDPEDYLSDPRFRRLGALRELLS
jgi:hypothetical protein